MDIDSTGIISHYYTMEPIRIGFLSPYSGVYPYYAQHLITGWLLGMDLDPTRQKKIAFIPSFTKLGGPKSVTEAIQKMLFFDKIDVLSGLISYKSTPDLIPMIDMHQRMGFFFDMGEYIPYFPHISPNIFYASNQLWQSEYALGYWAQKNYGEGGLVVMPVYEAGYHLSSAFQRGAAAGGSTSISFKVLQADYRSNPENGVESFLKEAALMAPAYIHAIFTGKEGTEFLEKWKQSSLHKSIPLLITETMAYDDILEDITNLDMTVYSANTWNRKSENRINQAFVTKFESLAKQRANIYALMGYEAGLVWKELLPFAEKRDWSSVKNRLQQTVINGPRGEKGFYPASGLGLPEVSILRIKISGNKINKLIVDQQKGIMFNHNELEEIHTTSVSGWLNPFLCV